MVYFTLEILLRRLRKVWDSDMEILKHSLIGNNQAIPMKKEPFNKMSPSNS